MVTGKVHNFEFDSGIRASPDLGVLILSAKAAQRCLPDPSCTRNAGVQSSQVQVDS